VLTAISKTVEFTKWLSDELAAQIYGVAGDDIIRLEQKLESLKAKLEVPLDIPLDSLPWADEVQKEIDKVQKQIDDFYASAGTKTVKTPTATVIPVVPVVTGGAGIVEETPEAKAAREKAEKDAEAVHKLRVETFLKDESDKWAALEEYEKEYAEKQAEFADAHKQATLSDVEYELSKLQEQYDAYGTYIDDKVALDEWYAASKKKILDKQKDDETKMIAELKTAIEGWGKDSADAIVQFARTGEMSFREMIDSMIDDLMRMMIYQKITGPLFSGIGSMIGGGGGGGLLPSSIPGITTIVKHGNVFSNGRVIPFAHGGIIPQPTIFPMATGAGLMGEAGPEAIMPLTRIGGDLGVKAVSGSRDESQPMNVNVVITAVDAASFKELMRRNPGVVIEPIVTGLTSQGNRPLINAVKGVM
jgi:lambda family phage tail tape measure protein